ncbi:MAG: hypothetical protein K2W96_28925 [Gemmataceae bacterium]|nr:hypothetical protein [Gemmataceae bacterium]
MDAPSADELREARRPLASLLGKSEKALPKLVPGTRQHTMLRGNVEALRMALALMDGESADTETPTRADLRTLASMADRAGGAQSKLSPGTSQHTLLRNRLRGLRVAEALIGARLHDTEAAPGAAADGGGT